MSITGGIKFFDENACLSENGASCVASSGTVVESNILDKRADTYWTSVGSNDTITETLTITFGSATVSRLLLLDFNWKQFTAQYWNGSTWTDFSSVVGLDGSKASISETTFADQAAYYEFGSVTTTQLKLTATKTQTAGQEKYLATVLLTSELGTLKGYPNVSVNFARNVRTMKMLSGLSKMVKNRSIFSATLGFQNYPIRDYGADLDLIASLIDRESAFHTWLCGGRRGSTYFSYPVRGWRLKDCYRTGVDSDLSQEFTENIYTSGQNLGDLVITEHV